MQLFMAGASPYVAKCRIVVRELGLMGQVAEVPVTVKPTEPNRDYGETINPLRKIPALVIEGGTVLVDSRTITAYLADVAEDSVLYPDDPALKWRVMSAAAMADGIMDCAVSARYEMAVRPADRQWSAWSEDQLGKVGAALDWFEANLHEGPFDISHAALAAALGYLDFRFGDIGWRRGRPKLTDWFEAAAKRPAVAEALPR